ncbi:unnamed protein product, partial [Mesorhabditis spiculigera]
MPSFFRKLCSLCGCGDPEDDMNGAYDRLSEDENGDVVRVRGNDQYATPYPIDRADANGYYGTPGKPNEEAMLNGIVNETQEGIIDVTQNDGITLPTNEYMSRYNAYSDAINKHDVATTAAPAEAFSLESGWTGMPIKHRYILDDSGAKINDRYQKTELAYDKYEEYSGLVAEISTAVNGMAVANQKELLGTL